jgi:hypothetical protein
MIISGMPRKAKIALAVLLVGLAIGIVAAFANLRLVALSLLIPIMCVSGLAIFGHLITLDDDFPGNWSNPGSNPKILKASLLQLLFEVALCAAAVLGLSLVKS